MEDGILFIDKEEGMTSRKLDNLIGHVFHTRKVGHLGTLDPFATGLIIVGVNKGNKALTYAKDEEKTYQARLILGKATDTGDKTGIITETKDVPPLSKAKIEATLSSFLGMSMQLPPMTSAIKKDGVALYKLAHKGETIEREKRPIEVYAIRLLEMDEEGFSFEVSVSKGTYIRVLGEDIAKALGTVGYLDSLRRISVGDYTLENAHKFEEINGNFLQNPLILLGHLPSYQCNEKQASLVKNGVKLKLNHNEPKVLMVYEDQALAVYSFSEDGYYHSERGLF